MPPFSDLSGAMRMQEFFFADSGASFGLLVEKKNLIGALKRFILSSDESASSEKPKLKTQKKKKKKSKAPLLTIF